MKGRLVVFLEQRSPCWVFHEVRRGAHGASRVVPGKSVLPWERRGGAGHCSRVTVGESSLKTRWRRTHKVFLGLRQENLDSLYLCRWAQGASQGASEKSGILWSWEGPLGTPLGLVQWKRASSLVEVGNSGFLSISDSGRRVPAELRQESQASSYVEAWNSACRSSCSRGDRPLVELYLETTGFSERCTGVSVPLCLATSSTGLHWKRCSYWHRVLIKSGPGHRTPSECGTTREATSQIFSWDRSHPEVRREGREPLPDKAGESTLWPRSGGEKGLRGIGPGKPQCSSPGRPVCRGNLSVASRLPSTVSNFKTARGTSLETRSRERASSCDGRGTTWFFSSCGRILELQRRFQDASCVDTGKSNLPFEVRGRAGDCSRITAEQIDLI